MAIYLVRVSLIWWIYMTEAAGLFLIWTKDVVKASQSLHQRSQRANLIYLFAGLSTSHFLWFSFWNCNFLSNGMWQQIVIILKFVQVISFHFKYTNSFSHALCSVLLSWLDYYRIIFKSSVSGLFKKNYSFVIFSPNDDAQNFLVFVIGTLLLCVLDNFMKTCRMIKCLKMIIFVMMSMGIYAAALIFWIWTGFLHLGILVKMSYVKGISI